MKTPVIILVAVMIFSLTIQSCSSGRKENNKGITTIGFGKLKDSIPVTLYSLVNKNGIILKVTNYGGIITSLSVPDKNGKFGDIVLGYDSLKGYLEQSPYFGAIIGRYGNRIANGKFRINGKEYTLARNNGSNHLHGGLRGFDKMVWETKEFENDSAVGLKFHYLSPDGEEGYPGNLDVTVTYSLTDNNNLIFSYHAITDQPTPVNLTQHSYFNLAVSGDIRSHELMINASKYTVVDSALIPTGELRDVSGTPFDFRNPKSIGSELNFTGGNPVGYDHNFILDTKSLAEKAVEVFDPVSGRVMEVYTDQPGLQFYSGNFLDGSISGKRGKVYNQYDGFCLETQHFPDSPNQPSFPSTLLLPGQEYNTTTIYRFTTR